MVYLAEAYINNYCTWSDLYIGKPESSGICMIVATSFLYQRNTYQYACVGPGAAYYAQIFT